MFSDMRWGAPLENNASDNAFEQKPLDWRDRRDFMQDEVRRAFQNCNSKSLNAWQYKGDASYKIGNINEFALIKSIIKNNPDRKAFYFADIGAGNFALSRGLVEKINADPEVSQDVIVHIISVTAEPNRSPLNATSGKCRTYELSDFKIECMEDEFKRVAMEKTLGFDLKNFCDGIFTRWCLIHLIDPLGTLVQMINMLRAETGLLLADGFKFTLNETMRGEDYRNNLFTLLNAIQMPFLVSTYTTDDMGLMFRTGNEVSINHFVLKKPNNKPCELPLRYQFLFEKQLKSVDGAFIMGFKPHYKLTPIEDTHYTSSSRHDFVGDKALFDYLHQNALTRAKYLGPLVKEPVVANIDSAVHSHVNNTINDNANVIAHVDNVFNANNLQPNTVSENGPSFLNTLNQYSSYIFNAITQGLEALAPQGMILLANALDKKRSASTALNITDDNNTDTNDDDNVLNSLNKNVVNSFKKYKVEQNTESNQSGAAFVPKNTNNLNKGAERMQRK